MIGVDAADLRAAARLYATGGAAAIYYGLGVTEHSQGSTMVMGMANNAMATGNIGSPARVNPLRGQNNVQGSCDMGSFPHELTGYRHVSDDATARPSSRCGRHPLGRAGPAHHQHARRGRRRHLQGLYIQGEDIAQSDPDTHQRHRRPQGDGVHRRPGHLPQRDRQVRPRLPARASFLEKDGTFTNAERRISRVRKVMAPLGGYGDWRHDAARQRARLSDDLHPSVADQWTRSPGSPRVSRACPTPSWKLGSIQWPCNDKAPLGTPMMHVDRFVRGLGKFMITEFVPTDEHTTRKFPLILTTGRILSQYNVGAQTRRTHNSRWHEEDVLRSTRSNAETRGIVDGDLVALESRSGDIALRARVTERMQPGVVYTTFHHAKTGANVITTDYSDWATNCPEYKVTAVQVRRTNRPSDWQARSMRKTSPSPASPSSAMPPNEEGATAIGSRPGSSPGRPRRGGTTAARSRSRRRST